VSSSSSTPPGSGAVRGLAGRCARTPEKHDGHGCQRLGDAAEQSQGVAADVCAAADAAPENPIPDMSPSVVRKQTPACAYGCAAPRRGCGFARTARRR